MRVTDELLAAAGNRFGPAWTGAIFLLRQTSVLSRPAVLAEIAEVVNDSAGAYADIDWKRVEIHVVNRPSQFARRDRALAEVAVSLATGRSVDLREIVSGASEADISHITAALTVAGQRP